jgi:hypothetical protein
MELLRRFLRLPTTERRLLIKATLLLESVNLGMGLLPFHTLRRLLSRLANTPKGRPVDHASAEKVAWAVETASQNMLGVKTCLARALAAQVLLSRRGYPALLHIGVARGEQEQFRAHAWVDTEDKTVIGGSEIGRYAPLAVLVEGPRELRGKGFTRHNNFGDDARRARKVKEAMPCQFATNARLVLLWPLPRLLLAFRKSKIRQLIRRIYARQPMH